MNVGKLRKAAEMILEALGEDDPSTGGQGASGGGSAKSPLPTPPREDPEVALLNDLLAKYPDDVRRLLDRKVFVSDGYADDPRTVCSAKPPNGFTQSRLGFLNQLRIARGLPRIAIRHDEAGRLKRFELMP